MSAASISTERRFDRGAWLTLAFVLGFALFSATVSVLILRLPSDGCVTREFDSGARILDVCYGDWPTPLQPGDELLVIGGIVLRSESDMASARLASPSDWRAGATIQYTVRRDGAPMTLAVPIGELNWAGVAGIFGYTSRVAPGDTLGDWPLYLSALVIFLLVPRSAAAQLFFVAAGTHFAALRLGGGGDPILAAWTFAPLPLYYANWLIGLFWLWLFFPALLLFVLSFPRQVWPVSRWPRLAPLLCFLVPFGLCLAGLIEGSGTIFFGMTLAEFILILLSMLVVTIDTFRSVRDPVVRAQTGWLLLGLTIYVLELVVGYSLFLLAPGWFAPSFEALPLPVAVALDLVWALSLPLCLGIAITRYRLFDINIVIRRTLVAVPLTVILAAIFSIAQGVSSRFFTGLWGENSPASTVLITLILVAVFEPLKKRIGQLVDKVSKQLPDPAPTVKAFRKKIQSRLLRVNRETITKELLEEVVLGFGVTSGAVYLDGEDTAQPVHATRSWDGVAKMTIPIRSTDEGAVLGVMALGPQRMGGEYTSRQREMLQEMAQFVAAAIEQDRQRTPLQTRVIGTTDYLSGEKFVYVSGTGSKVVAAESNQL